MEEKEVLTNKVDALIREGFPVSIAWDMVHGKGEYYIFLTEYMKIGPDKALEFCNEGRN